MGQGGVPPEAVGVAVLAAHNIVVHRVLPAPVDAALNLATALGLTAFAGHVGCSPADLGIRREDLRSGLRTGLCAAAVAAGGVAAGAALPATRGFFYDERVSGVSRSEDAYHLVLRIPLATALAEELLFRGALLAMLRQRRPTATAVLWASLLFGAWHVLPTVDHYRGNPASALATDPGRGRRLAVLAAAVSTTGAGGVFAWLRLRSRSVLAPTLAHAAVNGSAYLAGRWLVERGQPSASVEKRTSTVSSGRRSSASARAARTRRSGPVSGGWNRLRGHNRLASTTLISAAYSSIWALRYSHDSSTITTANTP
jgi:membrane protease YdiL (CAAX protease family)